MAAYAIISVGGPALVPRPSNCSSLEPVRLNDGASEAAARIVGHIETFLAALPLLVPGVKPAIMSVLPVLGLSEEALALFRSLSETLRKTAKQREALFLDVKAILRRHLADAVSPPGPVPGPSDGAWPSLAPHTATASLFSLKKNRIHEHP